MPAAPLPRSHTRLSWLANPLHQPQTYDVYGTAVVGGVVTPTSNTLQLVMPTTGAPALTEAYDTGPTTGCARAAPRDDVTFTSVSCLLCSFFVGVQKVGHCFFIGLLVRAQCSRPAPSTAVPPPLQCTFTAYPASGGTPVTTTVEGEFACFSNLQPATQYQVSKGRSGCRTNFCQCIDACRLNLLTCDSSCFQVNATCSAGGTVYPTTNNLPLITPGAT